MDVACLGDTFAPDFGAALDEPAGDLRGAGFFVEGLIYPRGTIPSGPGFDPESATAIGTWLCRGWFMLHAGHALPHVISNQEYMLGIVSPKNPTPKNQLASSGTEGGVQRAVRSVIGGTGRYRRARRGRAAPHRDEHHRRERRRRAGAKPSFRLQLLRWRHETRTCVHPRGAHVLRDRVGRRQ